MRVRSQRGQYALITALGLIPAFTVAAMSIDLARASMTSSEAELVAFAAAQTAIVAYDQGKTIAEAEALADEVVRAHATFDGVTFTLTDVQWGHVDRSQGTLVAGGDVEAARATVARTGAKGLATWFGAFVGVHKIDIGTSAISDTLPSAFDRDDCDTRIVYHDTGGDDDLWNGGGIARSDFDKTVGVRLEDVDQSGWYAVYKDAVAESGPSQRNESSFFRIVNDANPIGLPREANCQGDFIVPDYDNDGISTERVYLGTFWFDEDSHNYIFMHHYCSMRDICPLFEDPAAQCGDSYDSIHMDRGDGALCLEAL